MNVGHIIPGTNAENARDRIAAGTSNRGESHGMSKLTAHQVLEIRARCIGKYGEQTVLAVEYGVTKAYISDIVRRKRWAWLDDKELVAA